MRGAHIEVGYRGKSGIARHVHLEHAQLARVVCKARALPGRRLFQYRDDDTIRTVTSNDVNRYLHDVIGASFSAKDFRTWAATLWCALVLSREPPPESKTAVKRTVSTAIAEVADHLGHTPTVCRTSYIHPGVLAAFGDGRLHRSVPAELRRRVEHDVADLRAAERHVLGLLAA